MYVFGRFKSHRAGKLVIGSKQQNQPRAPSHFGEIYASDICLGPDFLALLTEVGQVFCFDDCLDLVQLPSVSDSKVQSLGATTHSLFGLSSTLHTESGGLLQEWTSSSRHWNEQYFLDKMVRGDAIPCSLHAWKGALYLLDEPWDASLSVSQSKGDLLCLQVGQFTAPTKGKMTTCGQHISESVNSLLGEYTLKLLGAGNVADQQTVASPSDNEELGTAEDQKTFERVLEEKLAEEQRAILRKTLTRILKGLYLDVIGNVRDSGVHSQYRKRLHGVVKAVTVTASLREKILRARVSAGFSSVKHYSAMQSFVDRTRQQEEAYAKMSREEATKMLFRVLTRVANVRTRAKSALFVEKLVTKLNYHQRAFTLISRLCKLVGMNLLRTERVAVKQWRELVVLEGMRKWGLGKLVRLLGRIQSAQAWTNLLRWNQRQIALKVTFEKLMRRRMRENRREAVGRSFSLWKHTAYQLSLQRLSHLQALQVSFKALSNMIRRLLRFHAYNPGLKQIAVYAEDRYRTAKLRHPLLFFASIYDKVHTRAYSCAFNAILRFNPEAVKARRRQCIQALARIGSSTTRSALRDIVELSNSILQQLTIDLVFRLEQIVEKVEQRSLEYAFSMIWNEDSAETAGFKGRESMVVLGESQELALARLSQVTGRYVGSTESGEILTSRTSYYSPEETASFLTRDAEDGRPFEYATPRKDKGGKPKFVYKSNSSAGVSPNNGGQTVRPPWRAPSRSGPGMVKNSLKDSNMRRRQYDSFLKERRSKSRVRAASPPSQPPPVPKLKGLIDIRRQRTDRVLSQCERNLSSASTERRDFYPMEKNLSTIVGAKSLQKVQTKRVISGWLALKRWAAQGDGFSATLGKPDFVSTFPLKQEKTHVRRASQEAVPVIVVEKAPDDQELESNWKTRLIKVGCQRIGKLVDRRNSDLMISALRLLHESAV